MSMCLFHLFFSYLGLFVFVLSFFQLPVGFLKTEKEGVGICAGGEVGRIFDEFEEKKP